MHTHTQNISIDVLYNLNNIFNIGLQAAYKSNPNDEDALRAIDLLYDAALVSSGFTVSDHSFFLFSCSESFAIKNL
jgi:HSP90 family molecular chaperone